jgi:hypothetical protein
MDKPSLRTVNVTRYVTPLREGGSLPAIAEADDGFLYVLKFRGAGQGIKSLIAELIGGELARTLKASVGLNLGLHYLSGSITFDPVVNKVDPLLASRIVWLDCLLTNVDRTARNTNMLVWNKELWLIDHGASLYFHHAWDNWKEQAAKPFAMIKDHVLLPFATRLEEVDQEFHQLLTPEKISAIVQLVPDEWLTGWSLDISAHDIKEVYTQFLTTRLTQSQNIIKAAQHARQPLV